jgi:hypothetical protein
MVEKIYEILLGNRLIGTTKLEFGDPPMGVVFGKINFAESDMGYGFVKQYCIDNSIEIKTDYSIDKFISTGRIEGLKIYNSENIEISGLGNNIEGMDSDGYTVTILGLDSEIYGREFPEHISEYERKFKK